MSPHRVTWRGIVRRYCRHDDSLLLAYVIFVVCFVLFAR
jgi:hypothetical protein